MKKNTQNAYGSVAIGFHWLTAVLVVFMLFIGFDMHGKAFMYQIHKLLGLFVLCVIVARVIWRLNNISPALPENAAWFEKSASWLMHWALLLLVTTMALTGWIMSSIAGKAPSFFGLFSLPAPVPHNITLARYCHDIHEFLPWVIIGLVALHILAAVKHHLWDKDDVLTKMLPKGFKNEKSK